MQLTKLEIKNFKKIENAELDLADVNILVGANGCGKSSIIQAVHLACCVIRQSDRIDAKKTATVAVDELDYLPTDEYKSLGHKANWGNADGSPSSQIALTFTKDDGTIAVANCKLRSARNAGISITGSVHADLTNMLRIKKHFFSAYIPGISGIPNKEDKKSKKVILKACSYGDSNVILRNALLLLKEIAQENIERIQDWISRIVGPISIHVSHNNDNDLYISCKITIDGTTKPIELVGTGYLQLIQIFSYILLFKPGVLLIDEPDIHLHPHVQERLVSVLSEVATERGVKILLTTHSPFIVRGAPSGTNVFWLQDGKIESQKRELVEIALGWGAFGKKIILVSEDTKTELLRKIISQWPELSHVIAFYPGNGFKNLLKPNQAKELALTLGGKFKILVHRDRDSLTDDETRRLKESYMKEGAHLWLPEESDVESYFCSSDYLGSLLRCAPDVAVNYITTILRNNEIPIREQFNSQRTSHNQELYPAGGSPPNEDVWNAFQNRPLKGAKGKFVFKQLKNTIPAGAYSEINILKSALNGEIALDLKHAVEECLKIN